MKPIRERKPKHHYFILLGGEKVGESWAVSSQKAITNWWWKHIKDESAMTPRDYDPSDFDAVEY